MMRKKIEGGENYPCKKHFFQIDSRRYCCQALQVFSLSSEGRQMWPGHRAEQRGQAGGQVPGLWFCARGQQLVLSSVHLLAAGPTKT